MTFEYAPDWMESLLRPTPYASAGPDVSSLSRGAPPAHPEPRQVAALVNELFAEGTLSAEQFRSLLSAPELEPYLDPPPPPHRIKTP
jgi:hypothetical protein